MPTIYDIRDDRERELTQDDADRLTRCSQAFGQLVTHLRAMPRPESRDAAAIAVAVSQGNVTITEGAAQLLALRDLLELPPRAEPWAEDRGKS
jgi:hypothetical protein